MIRYKSKKHISRCRNLDQILIQNFRFESLFFCYGEILKLLPTEPKSGIIFTGKYIGINRIKNVLTGFWNFVPYSIIKKAVGSNGNNRQISRVPKLNVRVEPDNWTTSTLNEVYNGAQIIRYNPFIIETSIIITI